MRSVQLEVSEVLVGEEVVETGGLGQGGERRKDRGAEGDGCHERGERRER